MNGSSSVHGALDMEKRSMRKNHSFGDGNKKKLHIKHIDGFVGRITRQQWTKHSKRHEAASKDGRSLSRSVGGGEEEEPKSAVSRAQQHLLLVFFFFATLSGSFSARVCLLWPEIRVGLSCQDSDCSSIFIVWIGPQYGLWPLNL